MEKIDLFAELERVQNKRDAKKNKEVKVPVVNLVETEEVVKLSTTAIAQKILSEDASIPTFSDSPKSGYIGAFNYVPEPSMFTEGAEYRNKNNGTVYKKVGNLWEEYIRDGKNGAQGMSVGGGCGVEEVKRLAKEQAALVSIPTITSIPSTNNGPALIAPGQTNNSYNIYRWNGTEYVPVGGGKVWESISDLRSTRPLGDYIGQRESVRCILGSGTFIVEWTGGYWAVCRGECPIRLDDELQYTSIGVSTVSVISATLGPLIGNYETWVFRYSVRSIKTSANTSIGVTTTDSPTSLGTNSTFSAANQRARRVGYVRRNGNNFIRNTGIGEPIFVTVPADITIVDWGLVNVFATITPATIGDQYVIEEFCWIREA